MPRRYKKKSNRPRRRPARKGRKSMPSIATAGKGQMAKIVETIEFNALQPNITSYSAFTLSQFPRAATLAGNFAFYKAAKVIWNYEPLYNTFQDTAGASSAPYLYTVMNRGQVNQTLPAPGLKNIQACGARPVKLVSKTTIAYKPNWCSPGLLSLRIVDSTGGYNRVVQQGLKQQYSWLSCSGQEVRASGFVPDLAPVIQGVIAPDDEVTPAGMTDVQVPTVNNSVVYNGHINYIDQLVDANTAPVCRLTATVEWHFKGALFNQEFPAAPPPPAL